jgi:hypothetical protein
MNESTQSDDLARRHGIEAGPIRLRLNDNVIVDAIGQCKLMSRSHHKSVAVPDLRVLVEDMGALATRCVLP